MPKTIPEIQITSADKIEENRTSSPDICSGGVTDNEFIEINADHLHQFKQRDVLFTDIEYSSDEGENYSCHQSIEYFPSDLEVGESLEQVSSVHSPGKTQRSIVYCLKTNNSDQVEDYATDLEGISASDDDTDSNETVFTSGFLKLSEELNENTNIKDSLITKKVYSPAITPEPTSKKNTSPAFHLYEDLTDTEFIFSDHERRLRTNVLKTKKMSDGFASDAEDSDSSLSENPLFKPRKNSLQVEKSKLVTLHNLRKCSEPFLNEFKTVDSKEKLKFTNINVSANMKKNKTRSTSQKFQKSEPRKNKIQPEVKMKFMQLPIEDKAAYTDTEEFEFEGFESEVEEPPVVYVPETKREIIIANENIKGDVALIFPIKKPSDIKLTIAMETADCGFSDVEELPGFEFESEVRICKTPEPPLPEASYIKTSETLKEKSKLKKGLMDNQPLTDTEDLYTYKEAKLKKFKQKNSSSLASSSFLKINKQADDPLTDTEVVFLNEKVKDSKKSCCRTGNNLTVSNCPEPLTDTEDLVFSIDNGQKKTENHSYCLNPLEVNDGLTDVEDLDMEGGVIENISSQNPNSEQTHTDVEEFTGDEMEESKNRKTYRDYEVISSCNSTAAKESHRPFSKEVKAKFTGNTSMPHIRRITPSPLPCATDQEDISGEEEALSMSATGIALDDCNLEPHASTVHIRHTRMFQPRRDELKANILPDPLTDVEELDIQYERKN